jgi:hypothetical protein
LLARAKAAFDAADAALASQDLGTYQAKTKEGIDLVAQAQAVLASGGGGGGGGSGSGGGGGATTTTAPPAESTTTTSEPPSSA